MISIADYDIVDAFRRIEDELIASMIRNMDRHKAEEKAEGFQWSQWQVEQLKALEKYKQANRKKYGDQFADANRQIGALIRECHLRGGMEQEKKILQAVRKGYKVHGKNATAAHSALDAKFFRLNERKLEALIQATTRDMKKAETAILRQADDQYRKAIFSAQVYANAGGATYEKAVDMATKDMLGRGLACVEYKNGTLHHLEDYADMAIRTATKRAYLQGEGEKRQEWSISTVIMNKRGNPCPKCLPWVGKVLIDDVWSAGKASDGDYPLMSYAVSKGLYHPRCQDSHTTYFPGVSTADDTWTQEELEAVDLANRKAAQKQYADRQAEKYGRLSQYSLDPENKEHYQAKADAWEEKAGAYTAIRNTNTAVSYDSGNDYNVDVPGYSEDVNQGLSKAIESVAKKGTGDGFEHMHLVDLETGELAFYETNGEPGEVGYDFWKHIDQNPNKKFAFVHNHNVDSSFSEPDIRTLLSTPEIPMMVAARNDAVIYVAEKASIVPDTTWYDDLYPDEIEALNKAVRDGKMTALERARQREMMIVDNLLRDYTKGGKLIEYDGRK